MCANHHQYTQGPQLMLVHFILIVFVFLVGCNQGQLPTYRAGGKVTFTDGNPLEGGMVTLRAIEAPKPISARGDIQPDGTFQLSTFSEADGALEGEHQVAIQPPPPPVGIDRDKIRTLPPPPFDEKYMEFETSGLTVTVTRKAADNDFPIEIERAK